MKSIMTQKKIIILTVVVVLIIAIFLTVVAIYNSHKKEAYAPIVVGENHLDLDNTNISTDAEEKITQVLDKSADASMIYTVSFLNFEIDKKGNIKSFNLALDSFDDNKNYVKTVSLLYKDKKLDYKVLDSDNLPHEYNENNDYNNIISLIKEIPITDEIKVCGLTRYCLQYQPETKIDEETPVFLKKENGEFPVLSMDQYNSCAGGKSNGIGSIIVRLFDGTSIACGQQYYYIFDAKNDDTIYKVDSTVPENDYYLSSKKMEFLRNYGSTKIKTDLTSDQIEDTMSFYHSSLSLPPQSIFIASDTSLPIAYFYGTTPTLKITQDNGSTWTQHKFDVETEFQREITKRAVGFVTPKFGYCALGTDWSMGGGECKSAFFTTDGGCNWVEKQLPEQYSSNTLCDIAMCDTKNGILTLNDGLDGDFKVVYVTTDTGDSWQKIDIPFNNLPSDISYLSNIESFIFKDGKYTIVFGQEDIGSSGNKVATFSATELTGTWDFVESKVTAVHTVG